jgi:hypothetical protein
MSQFESVVQQIGSPYTTKGGDYCLSIPFKKLKIYRYLFISPVVFSAFSST